MAPRSSAQPAAASPAPHDQLALVLDGPIELLLCDVVQRAGPAAHVVSPPPHTGSLHVSHSTGPAAQRLVTRLGSAVASGHSATTVRSGASARPGSTTG